jgi:acetyl-CoA carboxylase biotin carboxyl carrier protein
MSTIESDTTATVWKVLVSVGDTVDEGDTVALLESMKMEIPMEAEESGTVTAVHVAEGDAVSDGDALVTLG